MNDLCVFERHIAIAEDIIRRLQKQIDEDTSVKNIDAVSKLEGAEWHASVQRLVEKVFGSNSFELRQWNKMMGQRSNLGKPFTEKDPFDEASYLQSHIFHHRACIILLTEFDVIHQINRQDRK